MPAVTDLSSMIDKLEKEFDLKKLNAGIGKVFQHHHRIRPGFSRSWLEAEPPMDSQKIKQFKYPEHTITYYSIKDGKESLLHLQAKEYKLSQPHMKLMEITRQELMDHYPRTQQLTGMFATRNYVYKFCRDKIYDLSKKYDISLGKGRVKQVEQVDFLARTLARYTAGLGVLEHILNHEHIQDIYLDSPVGEHPVYTTISAVDHRLTQTCRTNITMGPEDAEGLLSRFRYISGRPFSEAKPVLECDLSGFNTRVTVIGPPLSPEGTAFALRRHSTEPWTLLRLIDAGSITPMFAGLISFLVSGRSTIIVAGSRGAGKTSLLSAIMMEFPGTQRVLTIEDTPELPGERMRELGYKVQSLTVSSGEGIGEMGADDALRVALRLGESALVMGEVRGPETKTLYEAMSAGTAGSSVMGTFHADSAEGVYKRVVSDMGISPESFSATDIVIVAGLIQPKGVNRRSRRVLQVSELIKDAKEPGGFRDLMSFNHDTQALEETKDMSYHSERISGIAHSWQMSVEEAIENIRVRAKIKELMVIAANRKKNPRLLGAEWVVRSNSKFDELTNKYSGKGKLDHRGILQDWKAWYKGCIRNG